MSTTIKRITVLCDGTGQDGTVKEEERHSNIYRLLRLINDKAGEIEQRVHYQAGIGSAKDFYSKHFDGLVAATLGKQINEAYKFIVDNFQPGDEIFLFGFSRGAYIAMIVAQIIGKIGVLGIVDFPEFQTIYENYVQLGKASSDKDMRESEAKLRPWTENDAPGKRRVSKNGEFSVKCLGLFDPVAATGTDPFRNLLGLPMKKNKIGLSRGELELSALVRELEPHIEYTYQALAINERREIFDCIRMIRKPSRAKVQILKQCWFVGNHSDIGGSYAEHEISDLTLTWMIDQIGNKLSVNTVSLYRMFKPKHEWGKARPHLEILGGKDYINKAVYQWNRVLPNSAADEGSAERTFHPSALEISNIMDEKGNEHDKEDREKLFKYIKDEITDSNNKLGHKLLPLEVGLKSVWPKLMEGIN